MELSTGNGLPNGKALTFPPGKGGYSIPVIQQAIGVFNTGLARLFRNPDEAFITDRIAAESMLNDLTIMEPLNSRIMATALLPWHIKPEDASDPEQVKVAKVIQGILEECPEFVKLRSSLLWGIWYGTAGVQIKYRFDFRKGFKRLVIDQFQPIHGDSIRHRWDEPGKVGIMVYSAKYPGPGSKDIDWVSSDLGPCHMLTDEEREQFVIHKHLLAMGSYFDPRKIGLSQGVGIRNYTWWMWRQKQEMLAQLSEYLERWGLGATIAKYPLGNPEFQQQAQSIAQNIDFSQVVTWPVNPNGEDTGGLERIVPDTAGIQNYMQIIEYYTTFIRQFISGASTGDNGDITIIGQDDSHENNFSRLIRFDAINLQDTITEQLVKVIQRWTFPETYNRFCCKFVINVDRPDPAAFMQAAKLFWDMGGTLSEAQVRNELRLSEPMPGERMLQQPQQPALGMPGQTNPFSGDDGGKPQLPSPGRSEGDWIPQEGPEGGEQLVNAETGSIRYTKAEEEEREQYDLASIGKAVVGALGLGSKPKEEDNFPWQDHHGEMNADLDAGHFNPENGGTWGRRRDGSRKPFGDKPLKPLNKPKRKPTYEEWAAENNRETYAKEDWERIEDGPKGGKRWRNKNSGKVSYKDPSRSSKGKAPAQGEARPAPTRAKGKQGQENTIKEAATAFTDKDAEALDRIAEKLRTAKGKRGEIAIAGLQAIAKAIGLKGVSRLSKDRLIESLVEKLGAAKAEAPQADFNRRIEKVKEAEARTGIPFMERLASQILSQRGDEEYRAAIADLEENGHDKSGKPVARPEAQKIIRAKVKQVIDQLRNEANPDRPSDELTHALESVAPYGRLSPAEAIDLAIEGGKVEKIAAPEKEQPQFGELTLQPSPRKAKPKPTRKQRDYLDRVAQKPLKVRNRQIAAIEQKTGQPFVGRVVNRIITDKILSPEGRSEYEKIRKQMQETGTPAEKLPETEMRFVKDYEAGQRYHQIQTTMLRANRKGVEHHLNSDDANFMRQYRAAVLSRLQFEDGQTFGPTDVSDLLEELSNKGYGSLRYDEFLKKVKNINTYRDRDRF